MQETSTIYQLAESDPEELTQFLIRRYTIRIPETIDSLDGLREASGLLGRLANEKTFLYSLLSFLKVRARILKGKGDKTAAEQMAMRRDSTELILDGVKSQYDAVSRMVTVYKMQLDEMRMSGLL